MSFLDPDGNPIVFDPYHFPNFTIQSLERDVTFIVYGASIYEMIMCLHAYFSVCNRQKMGTAIFRLMTIAVSSLAISNVVVIILQVNLTRNDLTLSLAEYALNVFYCVLLVTAKYGYYMAATLRTRGLLGRHPRVLYCIYLMLAVHVINNIVILGYIINIYKILYETRPETFVERYPMILQSFADYQTVGSFTPTFDMVFANVLSVTFLYPIFTTLEMSLVPSIKAMFKLGDVQKALCSSLCSILFVIFMFTATDPQQLSISFLFLWMHTQNTQFLRLSYFGSVELLTTHSKVSALQLMSIRSRNAGHTAGASIQKSVPVDDIV